jgi:hypothetical protein
MKVQIYQVMHVLSMVLMSGFIFQAFANPDPKNKKRTMMIVGILSVLMLTGGMGLVALTKAGFPWRVIVKLVCWFGLIVIAGQAYRKPEKIPLFRTVAILLIATAITSVYFKNGITPLE